MGRAAPHVDELYSEACACIEQGLCYDEIDDAENALAFYDRSLLLMKEAEKEKNYKKSEMYKTMMEGKKRVEKRMKDLKRSKKAEKAEKPEAEKQKQDEDDEVKKELKSQIEAVGTTHEADLLYYIPEGVQLFVIEGENTSIPTYPSSLEIFRFSLDQKKPESIRAEAFMQVGPWSYPLIPGQTPVLKNDFGACVVPNPTPEHPNMFVGILLPKNLDKKDEDDFYAILKQYTEMRTQELSRSMSREEREHLSQKIGDFLLKVDKIGAMGMSVGRTLASGAERHLGDDEGGVVHGTIYVLGSGIASASTVWMALESASKTMARNIADETVDTVRHRWGDEASLTAHEALYATGHTSLAALQLWDLGPRSVAGRAARKAGIQFVSDLHRRSSPHLEDMDKKNV